MTVRVTHQEVTILGQKPSKYTVWEDQFTCSHSDGTPAKWGQHRPQEGVFNNCDAALGTGPGQMSECSLLLEQLGQLSALVYKVLEAKKFYGHLRFPFP